MSAPSVPARPARSQPQGQDQQQSNPASNHQVASLEPPQVPSRPARFSARDASRERDAFSRSPLNDLPSVYQQQSEQHPARGNRPPSVSSMPLIGQEGSEYASLDGAVSNVTIANDLSQPSGHARSIHHDLPLHAPTASISPVDAKSRIATVTRTDSSQAAQAGIARPRSEYEEQDTKRHSRNNSVQYRQASIGDHDRRRSSTAMTDELNDHGIPMIGYQVPMYPGAGDVQAPSPAPHQQSSGTPEGHRRQGHGFPAPPGSYGLHGHGVIAQDQFEKAWYQKHPEEVTREHGAYGPSLHADRSLYSMSSEDLNHLVRETSRTGSGLGTSADMISTPPETIGYQATEEYTHRMAARPASLLAAKSRQASFGHAESPLRRAVFPINDEKPTEDPEDNIYHIRPPSRNTGKITGGGYDPPTENLGPHGGNTGEQGGWVTERGSGTPILASDEHDRDPGAHYRLPAVSPEQQRLGDNYFSGVNSEQSHHYQTGAATTTTTRSRSRPSAGHSALSRFMSHDAHNDSASGTPLAEIEEYEPLFKDEEKEDAKRPLTAADHLKRPELEKHRFPSHDIWEDTPDSLRLETTVEHEQEPEETPTQSRPSTSSAAMFETPEKEAARKGEILESERLDFLSDPSKGYAKPKFATHLREEAGRPGMRQRFPSHDIWEDTPDSLRLETTVDAPQSPQDEPSPIEPRSLASIATNTMNVQGAGRPSSLATTAPVIPSRPGQVTENQQQPSVPSVPARPVRAHQVPTFDIEPSSEKPTEASPTDRKAPSIPDRPKPQIPARPARGSGDDHPSGATATGVDAGSPTSSDKSISAASQPKPAAPPRPATSSSKFASLKAGFMNDLNSRLQLGPQAPPKPQPTAEDAAAQDEEKAPLSDARKGRAKGPARRKPAASGVEDETSSATPSTGAKFSITTPWTVWSISSSVSQADLTLGNHAKAHTPNAPQLNEHPTASPLARNTAGESLQSAADAPKTTSGALAHGGDAAMDARAHAEESAKRDELAGYREASIGAPGDVPEQDAEKPLSAYVTLLPQREAAKSQQHEEQHEQQHGSHSEAQVEDFDVPGAFPEEEEAGSSAKNAMTSHGMQTGEMVVNAGGDKRTVYLQGEAQTGADAIAPAS